MAHILFAAGTDHLEKRSGVGQEHSAALARAVKHTDTLLAELASQVNEIDHGMHWAAICIQAAVRGRTAR